jgi:hypothetical protein
VSRTEVEETKALLGIMPVFLVVCIWQVGAEGHINWLCRIYVMGRCSTGCSWKHRARLLKIGEMLTGFYCQLSKLSLG